MLLSIVIPVYNVEKYIEECIQSILPQVIDSKEKIEILLINDGSTDNSGKICTEYGNKYPEYVRVFHNENQGLLLTRRFGYNQSRGEYILNCDSDDFFAEDIIYNLVSVIKKGSFDVVLFNMNTYCDGEKKPFFENIFTIDESSQIDKRSIYKEFLSSYSIVSMCCKCFKRQCIDIEKDYLRHARISNGEDTLQSLEIYSRSKSFYYINKSLYNYRISSGMTSRFDKNYFKSFKQIIEILQEYKEIWNLDEFDRLLAIKLFSSTGRAITQSRYGKFLNKKEHIEYLREIGEDPILSRYEKYFLSVRQDLQKNYRVLIQLLLKKKYWQIYLLLKIKNLLK